MGFYADCCSQFKALWQAYRWMPGVTDGSEPLPGTIGEFIQSSYTISYLGYPTANFFGSVPVIVVPPGDWDLWTSSVMIPPPNNETGVPGISLCSWQIPAPLPKGLSGNMVSLIGGELKPTSGLYTLTEALAPGTWPVPLFNMQFYIEVGGPIVRGNFAVSTPLNFAVFIDCSTDPSAPSGQFVLTVSGRRRR